MGKKTGIFSAVQDVAEKSSDTLPEVKQFVKQLQMVSSQVSDTIPDVKETIAEVKNLTVGIRKILPIAIICLVVAAISALGTMAGVVILLLK